MKSDGFIFCNSSEEHVVVTSGEADDSECEKQEMDKYPKEWG